MKMVKSQLLARLPAINSSSLALIVSVVSVLLIQPVCSWAQAVQEQDSLALVALYNATGGPDWMNDDNWLVGPVSTWHGVGAAGDRITHIRLSSNNLTGTLPPEIGDLTHLQHLDVWNNQLSGAIPPELGALSRLQLLNLGVNQFSSRIPSVLFDLTELRHLLLTSNQFSGAIPTELSNLSKLQTLNLGDNTLSGPIPTWLGGLTALQFLGLGVNQFSGAIPTELSNLSKLQRLALGGNTLNGPIPTWLASLTELRHLSLNINAFSGAIPPEIGNLTNLHLLMLGNNQLSGSIPPELGSLSNLRRLDLHGNQFSGSIPAELGSLRVLNSLRLANNRLSGSIPPELGSLPNLQRLDLNGNRFSGSIPAEIGNLTSLETLRARNNQLSGPIPPELGNLVSLEGLSLGQNELTGGVPPELGMLTRLETLTIGINPLEGALPLSLIHLSELTLIEYSGTRLCEPIDIEFLNWLSSIQGGGGVSRCSAGTQELAHVEAQETATIDMSEEVGARIAFTDASTTEGILTVNRMDTVSAGLDSLSTVTVESSGGPVTPDVVSPHRYWVAVASGLSDFTYEICLDVSGLPKVNHPDRLVIAKRDSPLDRWTPLTSTTTRIASADYVCSGGLDAFSQFGIASEAQYNPLPVESLPIPQSSPSVSAFPNPATRTATINFELRQPGRVSLKVYDLLGREVALLVSGNYPSGQFETMWSAAGSPSGVYIYRLETEHGTDTRALIVQR